MDERRGTKAQACRDGLPMFFRKLTFSNFRVHRVRAVLTISAIALAVSLVVSVTSGFESLRSTAHRFLATIMGTVDANITRPSAEPGGVPETLLAQLKADPAVRNITARVEESIALMDKAGRPMRAEFHGLDPRNDNITDRTECRSGRWFTSDDGYFAVLDQVSAEAMGLKVGDEFTIGSTDEKFHLQLVGIVQKPQIMAMFLKSIYVPLRTAQRYLKIDNPASVTRLAIDLKSKADGSAFAERWREPLTRTDPRLKIRLQSESSDEMDDHLLGLQILSYLGGTVSMLAATFIVFSAQSMGVAERQRTLAMMRAIGCYRWQIGWLVIVEGLVLAGVGLVLGVGLGFLWLRLLALRFDAFFATGIQLSWGGLLFACVGTALAAILASLLPSITAMRVSPLEAMNPLARPMSRRTPLLAAGIGLVLASLDAGLLFLPRGTVPRDIQLYGHFIIGLPGIMIGFFLMAPLFVTLFEMTLGPIIAPVFGLKFALLRQQLSSGIWRAAGTCAALMVGLAILLVMQISGHSMLQGWQLPTKFPDIFIFSAGSMLDAEDQAKLENVQGLVKGDVMPIAIASTGLGSRFFSVELAAMMPDATMFFGVDPDKAFRMMQLDFRQGSAEEASRLLKLGRHVVVTQEFHELKGLGLGDKITLDTTRNGKQEYTIAGVVWSPGIDVIVSQFDMGAQFDQRTVGSLFGWIEDAKTDFGVTGVKLFAANLQPGVAKEQILTGLQKELGKMGLFAGDVRHIKARIIQTFQKLLLMVSTVAFAAMGVSGLGVTNTIMASVRSRRWQFGVLRSIGLTRFQLLRLVMAEAFLLSLVGVGLGLAAGFTMAISAKRLGANILGNNPPLAVPWPMVMLGMGIIVGISMLASLWPAVHVARSRPLALLQAGRASA